MKKIGGIALSLCLLLCLLAVPGVLAEEPASVEITSLEQLNTLTSGSYKLAADLTIPETILLKVEKGLDITLDLNGHKVSKPAGAGRILDNYGTMTINDSSADKSGLVAAYRNGIGNYGTMTINGGTFTTACTEGGTTVYNVEGTMTINAITINASNFAINNDGEMVIKNGEFHSTSSNRNPSFAYCVRNTANMTIYNATVTGIQGALASASGVLTVYDGNYSTKWDDSASFYALYIAGEEDVVTGHIYGGTYSSPRHALYIGNDNTGGDGGINAKATTYVYGGTYTGGINAIYQAQKTGNPHVSGGTYRKGKAPDDKPDDVVRNYMAEGCTYNVETGKVSDPRVFSVSLDRSAATVAQGGTLKLTADCDAGAEADTSVTWTSDKTAVATVAADGTVTGVAAGTAVITAQVGDKSAACTVVVTGQPEVPTVDPEKPAEKVEVGVPQESADALQEAVADVVDQILKDEATPGLSDETKEAVKQAAQEGKPITVEVKAETVAPASVAAADAEKTLALVGEDGEVAQYLDLQVLLKADGESIGALTKLSEPIAVQVAIPADMLKDGRTFYVVRVHNGVAEKLATTVKDGVATFETDRFSTYALAYEDAAESTPTAPPTGRTGLLAALAAVLLLMTAAVLAVVSRKRRAYNR